MLANPITKKDFESLNPNDFIAEWKWDGIRVQIILSNNQTKIFSRTGDDITDSFPEITNNEKSLVILDGELLVGKNFTPLKFNLLQQRINRKKIVAKHLIELPAFIKLYDILFHNFNDVRNETWLKRREILEDWYCKNRNNFFDISKVITFSNWPELNKIKANDIIDDEHEGLMIKKRDSLYVSGRPKGYWFKWKIDPKTVDAILMYALRGHGKRSSYYSDFTFGLWDGNEISPICKAYFGFNDDELKILDKFVRNNTLKKFGPVREVSKTFVVEIAFDSINISKRHKSGIALRFPRVKSLRQDKPASEVIQLLQFKSEFIKNF
jgi:DNA ligase-1